MVPEFNVVLFYGATVLFIYWLIYGLVDRICNCCERCATTKAFGKFQEAQIKPEDKAKEKKHGSMQVL